MNEFFRLLFAPCRDLAELTSRSLDHDLPARQRIPMKVHLLYCKACRRYRAQIKALRRIFQVVADPDAPAARVLTDDARQRMKNALRPR